MPRAHYVRAGKDYPQFGIKKGEMHYTWAFFRQRPQRSLTRPTRSQLTSNEHLGRLYDLIDTELPACASASELYNLRDELGELSSEIESAKYDLPENFQNGEMGERYDARAQEISDFSDEVDSAASELGEEDDFKAEDSEYETYAEALAATIENLEQSAPDPE